jgi:hypothetical protein
MSVYTKNSIYDFVCNQILSEYPDAYISSVYEPVVPSFPAVFIREIGLVHNPGNVTFGGAQGVRTSTFEVQIQSNRKDTAASEVYDILNIVTAAFVKIFFVLENTNLIEDDDSGLYRLRASYRKVIGAADEMPSE